MNPLSLANRSKARDTMYSDDSSLNLYLKEIGAISLLTAEEERELGRRLQAAERDAEGQLTRKEDKEARDTMIKHNLRLVVAVAKGFHSNPAYTMSDRIQEGNIGLMRAVDRYDPSRGRFSTMATWWIRQAIDRASDERRELIRLPTHMITKINKMKKIAREKVQALGRDATTEELAEALGCTPKYVKDLQIWDRTLASLDVPIEGADDVLLADTLEDITAPDEYGAVDASDLREDVARAFATLTEREQGMMRMHFGLDDRVHTLAEVGREFGVSRERVRQIAVIAKKKLREPLKRFAENERAG